MPYAKHTAQRFEAVYRKVLVDDYPKRPFNIVKKEISVRGETLRRDLTKRQINIIIMLTAYSYPFGKDSCIIPKLQDFEMCGVSKTLIKKELEKLEELNMITWIREKDNNIFSVNEPVNWQAPFHHGYSEERGKDLLLINLKDSIIETKISYEDL